MSHIVKISEAASMALHTMAYLSAKPGERFSARHVAQNFGNSEAHLAKVLQRLAKAGLVNSSRGPKGGFSLVKAPEETSLLEVFEAIEGPLEPTQCLLDRPRCHNNCILGGMLAKVDKEAREYLSSKTLGDFAAAF